MIFTIFLIILGITISLHFYLRYSHTGKLMSRIPGPRGWPIIGNTFTIMVSPEEFFKLQRSFFRDFGNLSKLEGFGVRSVQIYNPHDVEILLSTTRFNQKREPYTFLKLWLREGLLTSNGTKWQQRRKLLTSAFHFNILKKYTQTFIDQAEDLQRKVQEEVGKEQTDLFLLISNTTLNIMCQTSMGISINGDKKSIARKYFKALHLFGYTVAHRVTRIWLFLDLIFQCTNMYATQRKALKDLHKFTKQIIQERKEYLEIKRCNEFNSGFNDEIYGKRGRLAMLDLLVQNEKDGKIDLEGIREEVDTFMFEGHDTTAMALCFMIMRISNEPEVQKRLHEEMMNIFGETQRPPTMEDFQEMKYLECCIKESLRLYPSVPFIARFNAEDVILSGYKVPAGTQCHIPIYDIHRRSDFYPDPEKFIPERFLPENTVRRHPYSYIPFSAGPRNCIGQKFAMLEMKTVMSGLIRRYQLEPVTRPEDITYKTDLILRPTKPLYVRFRSRR